MTKGIVFLSIAISGCFGQQIQLDRGAISGTLKGDDGTALVGGTVILVLTPPYLTRRPRRTEWALTTASAGSFQFQGLPGGTYRFCAYVPNSTWLNPCEWGFAGPVVPVSSSSPAASATLVMKKGAVVPIRIDDPGQLLSQHEGKTPRARLLLGLGYGASVFRLVPLVSQDSGGRNHQIAIPYNTPVKLVVHSSLFNVNDAAGLPLARGGATVIPLSVLAGQQVAPIKFSVTGINP